MTTTPASKVLDRVLVLEMVRVTEAAAIHSARLIGRGDEKAADAAAVEAMREKLNELPIDGTVVIGEGERDEAPMLYIGEKVGNAIGTGPKIDIALDPFPCNGGTTTFDTLWMGVPLVSLEGGHMMARMGGDLLRHAGLGELAVSSEEAYAKTAIQLANDLPRLRSMRDGLRDRVRQSPLMDAPLFARNFEAAMRGMWQEWCQRQKDKPPVTS